MSRSVSALPAAALARPFELSTDSDPSASVSQSNIEQCGACASAGGVDCTLIEGAAAVGCVAGVCEVWACEEGFAFDATAAACVSF